MNSFYVNRKNREYYNKNKNKILEHKKDYYNFNKKIIQKKKKEYYERNKKKYVTEYNIDDMKYIIQSVILPKKEFTFHTAKLWIKKHNYRLTFYGKQPDETEDYYRFRQASPTKFDKKKYITKEINDKGIKLILGIYK